MPTTSIPTTHEEIALRAFAIWCEKGRQPDMANDNWHAAERGLEREREHRALSNSQNAQDALQRAADKIAGLSEKRARSRTPRVNAGPRSQLRPGANC